MSWLWSVPARTWSLRPLPRPRALIDCPCALTSSRRGLVWPCVGKIVPCNARHGLCDEQPRGRHARCPQPSHHRRAGAMMTIRRILAECLDCRIRSGRDGSPPSQTSRDQATSSACLVSRATRTPGSRLAFAPTRDEPGGGGLPMIQPPPFPSS